MENNDIDSLVGKTVKARVQLHNYRYPKDKVHKSGEYAIVVLQVLDIREGAISPSCYLKGTGNLIIASGRFARLEEEMEYNLVAKLKIDKTWGPQYEISTIAMSYDLKDKEEQKKFFSFFLTENQVNTLFSSVDNPIELLQQRNIGELTKIKGIGVATANKICMKYVDNIDNSQAYIKLGNYGLTKNAIDKLIKQFGSPDIAIGIIEENPYSLINLVRGYGWAKADSIALNQGFKVDSKERCLAYANYKLTKVANEDGNSCIPIVDLINEILKICSPVKKEDLAEWLKEDMINNVDFDEAYKKMKYEKEKIDFPTFYYSRENKNIGLTYFRITEEKISDELQRIKDAPSGMHIAQQEAEDIIKAVEKEQGYEYTWEQRKAIDNILNNNVSILTGSSGTGKSSTIKPLIKIIEACGYTVAQCALSGRASSLLTEYTGLEGKTIHRLLKYVPEEERFEHNAKKPLCEDVIILDETSMVGEELFLSLIQSIKCGAKLVMLGDIKQLPPISVGNILSDCIRSGYVPTVTLTKIHRQALRSGIIVEASSICEGKSIVKNDFEGQEIVGELQDFKLIANADSVLVHTKVLEEYKRLVTKEHLSPDDIQIVVPVRSKGLNSCVHFNTEIQEIVNSDKFKKSVEVNVIDGGQTYVVTYKIGDRIIVTKNNYHAKKVSGGEVAIFNGNMGHITYIDINNMHINLGDDEDIIIPREKWNNVSLAYACTCHKLQGSQAKYVIVSLDSGAFPLLMREWLYTAITRARKYCILVGQPKAINTATRTSNIKIKQTWLKDLLNKKYMENI